MEQESLSRWLEAYGKAWEAKDNEAFTGLFSPGVEYFWTPFQEPKRGRPELGDAFRQAVSTQQNIRFGWRVLHTVPEPAAIHWTCSFTRTTSGAPVGLDGIFLLAFDDDGLCRLFREWWHSDEATE